MHAGTQYPLLCPSTRSRPFTRAPGALRLNSIAWYLKKGCVQQVEYSTTCPGTSSVLTLHKIHCSRFDFTRSSMQNTSVSTSLNNPVRLSFKDAYSQRLIEGDSSSDSNFFLKPSPSRRVLQLPCLMFGFSQCF